MKGFIAEFSARNKEKINDEMFSRTFEKPLVEYIVDSCKNLEVIPAIKFDGYEFITDQTKIRTTLEKRLIKDTKIKNNKQLERIVRSGKNLEDLLVLHFTIKTKGQEKHYTRRMLIMKELKGHHYMRGGKKILPLLQVVDNSTFVKDDTKTKDNILKFKTTQFPIDIIRTNYKLFFTDGSSIKTQQYRINLFTKVCNPLLYYFAQYGIMDTIQLFSLGDVMSVVSREIDPENYDYVRVNDGVFLEINHMAFKKHEFVGVFFATMVAALLEDPKTTFKRFCSKNYWLERLSDVFAKKALERGEKVLISFSKIMDPTTRKRLVLPKYHKRNTFMLVRWQMTNYQELIKKDNHDLKYKRIRANEYIAYYFDRYITQNINSLLNADNPPFERYERLLNAINETTLSKAQQSGGGDKESASSMFRYESYNDFDAINLTRYTFKGPTGINGGKNGVSTKYRDIYPSHIGRFDLNVCSASDPGLTGYLTANCKIGKSGYFDTKNSEPDVYDPVIEAILDEISIKGYRNKRVDLVTTELSRGKDGFLELRKRYTDEEMTHKFAANPYEYGLYTVGNSLKLRPRHTMLDKKGHPVLLRKEVNARNKDIEPERDAKGFMILIPSKRPQKD